MSDLGNDEDAALRRSLWEAYVYPGSKAVPADVGERCRDAIQALLLCRKSAADAGARGDHDTFLSAASHASVVWRLLAEVLMSWTVESLDTATPDAEIDSEHARVLAWGLLELANNGPQTHRGAFSVASPVLPTAVHQRLKDGLSALGQGEVQPMLAPRITGRHGVPWSWEQARLRAVQHVAFLRGGGEGKMAARQRVAEAIDVAAGTLKSWEERDLPGHHAGRVADAEEAGRLYHGRQIDPMYRRRPGEVTDAAVLALALEIGETEPLEVFAEAYKQAFAGRHWSRR